MDRTSATLRVLMLGPDPRMHGGVAAVEAMLLASPPEGVAFTHVATLRGAGGAMSSATYATALAKTLALLAGRGADLVHIHFASRGSTLRKTLLARMAFAFGVPVVMHAHGGGFEDFFAGLGPRRRRAVETTLLRAALVLGVSERWAAFYRDSFGIAPDKVAVLPNPVVFPEHIASSRPTDEVRFVFVGRVEPLKGIDELLDAFAAVHTEVPRVSLTLIGEGDLEGYARRAGVLGIADRVTFAGWLAAAEVRDRLAASDVFVLPSKYEGMPVSVLEAMAHGLPVIATPVGGVPEIVKSGVTGVLVDGQDPAALVRAMLDLARDPEQRRALGSAGREAAREYGIERCSHRLGELYARVMSPTRGRP